MRPQLRVPAVVLAVSLAGCASDDAHKRRSSSGRELTSSGRSGRGIVAAQDEAMDMRLSIGVLNERAVDRAMAPHLDAMIGCFERAGDARKYLSGKVVLRFMVTASGAVSDVRVVENALGNFAVERCLVDTGKRIRMPRPEGNQATDFEYPLGFRSSGETAVLEWSGEELLVRLGERAAELYACGRLGPEAIEAIAYIRSDGSIDSVGFVSQGPIDGRAGACVVAELGKLRLSEARTGAVLRAVFPLAITEPVAKVEPRRLVRRGRRK